MTDVLSCSVFGLQLPNQCFEELASDVYDEVDRRETEQGNIRYTCNLSWHYYLYV